MKQRRCLRNGGRPKAFWGALIGAAASLIGTGMSIAAQSRSQKEALAEQKRIQDEQERQARAEATTNSLNNYFATLKDVQDEEFEFKRGGRRRLRNAGLHITDGGVAIPVGNNTFLLRGSLHDEVNESGKTGIGLKSGNTEFEAQNNEIIDKRGKDVRVFSAEPMINGVSPAELVLSGANKDAVFNAQQNINGRRKLAHNGRQKARLGASFGTADYIGLGVNTLGSVLSGLWANSAYNDLANSVKYEIPDFYDEHVVAGPTTYNIGAQLSNVERNRLNTRRSIARNTASSSVALDRMQKADTDAMYQVNELWDTKNNKEAELRMKNAEMENNMRARNAAARNEYYRTVAQIRNNELATRMGLKQAAINSNVGMIQGIGSSIGGFLQQGIDNYENEQARIAQVASSENGSAKRMASMGYNFSQDELASLYNDALSNYERTGSTDDAADVRFWSSRINPRYARRHKLATPTRRTTPLIFKSA